jgi:hypothetical protein
LLRSQDRVDAKRQELVVRDRTAVRGETAEPQGGVGRWLTMAHKERKAARQRAEFHAEEIFHRREWAIHRAGWVLLALFLGAGVAGVFGNGPLARQRLVIGDNELEFDRFARRGAPTQWRIKPGRSAQGDGVVVIRISANFVERYSIEAIIPEPRSAALSGTDVRFEFDASDPDPDAVIDFHVEPTRIGRSEGELGIGASQPLRVSQFIYP